MRVCADSNASWRHGWRALAVLFLCAAAALAQAQSADNGDEEGAPPDRVARLSWIAGDLGLLPAGSQDWSSADLNRPLTTGDRLSTGDGARAELELGGASLRMAGDTDFGMLNLDDNLAQAELTQGTLNLSVRSVDPGQSYEIDTPTLALVVSQPGTYRVDVDDNGTGTRVTVFNGQATVYGENNARHDVFAGRSYQFGDSSLAALMVTDIGSGDAFDDWCSERDRQYAQAGASQQYVSADMVGYQDLDAYGSWQDAPDYGAVWYPSRVPVGWAPYRNGHWAWIAPWGWTWVDDLPWGFAPYHYGRWAWIRGAWGWIPGLRRPHPVYAPALVAFAGVGRGLSTGLRGGAPVGWFPLGPGEVYNPWYRCSLACYQRVNVTNIRARDAAYRNTVLSRINSQYGFYREGRAPQDITYANRNAPRGFTAVPGSAFADGQRVQRDLLRVDPHQLATAPVAAATGVAALRPMPGGIAQPSGRGMRTLPTADFRRSVVARTPPVAPVNPAPADGRAPLRGGARLDNVRVLNTQAGAARPATNGLPNVRRVEPVPPRANALPSARFVQPATTMRTLPAVQPIRRASPADTQPQPGVSFIAGPEPSRPQPTDYGPRPANTPTPSPRFERAPRYEQSRNQPMQGQPLRQPYYQPQQRERFNPSYEPMQRGNGQPFWQPQQRFQPAPRQTESPRLRPQPPQHGGSSDWAPPAGKYDPQH